MDCGGTVDRINLGSVSNGSTVMYSGGSHARKKAAIAVGCRPLRSARSECDVHSTRNDNSRFNFGFGHLVHFVITAITGSLSEESQETAPDAMDDTRKKTLRILYNQRLAGGQ